MTYDIRNLLLVNILDVQGQKGLVPRMIWTGIPRVNIRLDWSPQRGTDVEPLDASRKISPGLA